MFYYVYFDDPNNIGHDSLDVLEIVWETANCRFVSGPHNRVQTNLKSNENYYNYLTSCGFFSWHFFRFFWKFKPYHYLGIFPQRKATPVHTVKLRDVDRSTIQFCTLLAKGNNTQDKQSGTTIRKYYVGDKMEKEMIKL